MKHIVIGTMNWTQFVVTKNNNEGIKSLVPILGPLYKNLVNQQTKFSFSLKPFGFDSFCRVF